MLEKYDFALVNVVEEACAAEGGLDADWCVRADIVERPDGTVLCLSERRAADSNHEELDRVIGEALGTLGLTMTRSGSYGGGAWHFWSDWRFE